LSASLRSTLNSYVRERRVYKLTGSKVAVVIIGIFSTVGFVFAFYAGIWSGIIGEYVLIHFSYVPSVADYQLRLAE